MNHPTAQFVQPDQLRRRRVLALLGRLAHLAHPQPQAAEARALARELENDYPDVYWLIEGRGQMSQRNCTAAEQSLRKAVEAGERAEQSRPK